MEIKRFTSYKAYEKLSHLSQSPIDLTVGDVVNADRIEKYKVSQNGFDYLFATQRIDDQILAELQNLADEARVVEQFMAMKQGESINCIEGWESENRQVLHTACRDIFRAIPSAPEATETAKKELNTLERFLADLDSGVFVNEKGEKFDTMVQVGIGGSDLGPRALYLALKNYLLEGREVRFIANVDPDDVAEVLADINLETTLVNVVSKSGSTLETLTNESLVRSVFQGAGLDPALHFIAVTGEGSPMDDSSRYLATFHMYDYIGGRYSVTSMVGAVSLAFGLGFDNFKELLRGANDMDLAAESRDMQSNLSLLTAMIGIWNRNFLGHETVAVLPYSQPLSRFTAHLQQCDMESNGKSVGRNGDLVDWKTGPIIWGEPGTNGQHAFYQLLHQGTTVVPVEFIGFRSNVYDLDININGTTSRQKLVANMLAQSLAFAIGKKDSNPNKNFGGNRPGSVLLGERLTPYSMGGLLALYENKIAMQGFCWGVNSFDQEGVQLGKVLAGRLLDLMVKAEEGSECMASEISLEESLLRAAKIL
ncbi:MAG: glucose-6-phosphate isomerase [Desulfobulbaceae bacterium]|nr:glucose-6-phosphate isomerase [Desulfobulbaceae bacterium]